MKERLPGWTAKGRRVAGRAWRRVRAWRPPGWCPATALWGRAGEHLLGLSLGLSVLAGLAGLAVVLGLGSWLTGTGPGEETGSTTIRNLGIGLAAAVALPLAVWRARVADQQAKATDKQAETAQADLWNKRYQEGAALLGSGALAVRLAGIYALQRLAEEHPEQYHIKSMTLLCAFARNPTEDEDISRMLEAKEKAKAAATPPRAWVKYKLRADVQAAMEAISACHGRQGALERNAEFRLDLQRADLRGAMLYRAKLQRADLNGTELTDARLARADLTDASLMGATLIDANLTRAILTGAPLSGAIFSPRTALVDANLTGTFWCAVSFGDGNIYLDDEEYDAATGLRQEQLDLACADPDDPPKLEGVLDAVTGAEMVWQGRTLEGKPHPSLAGES